MGGEDDLSMGIEPAYHVDKPFLPVEVQAYLGFVHKEYVGLKVFCKDCQQNDEHLFFTAR